MADDSLPDGFPEHLDEAFFAGIIEASPEPFVVVDLEGTIRWASRETFGLLGEGSDTPIGRNMLDYLTPESAVAGLQAFHQYMRPDRPDTGWVGPPIPLDLQLGDQVMPAEVHLAPTLDPSFPGAVISLRIRAPETALYETIERVIRDEPLESVMTAIVNLISLESPFSIPVIGWGWDGNRYTSAVASPNAPMIDGHPLPSDLDGPTPWGLRMQHGEPRTDDSLDGIDPELRKAAEAAGAEACWVVPLVTAEDRPVEAAVIVWRRTPGPPLMNIARRMERICGLVSLAVRAHRSRQQLRHAARTDAVTGLLNRTALAERLIEIDRHPSAPVVGIIYCDLDHFKDVNDQHGHVTGDKALVVAAERIRSRVRSTDLVARVGGDEFIVVAAAETLDEVGVLAERLVHSFDDPVSVGDLVVPLGISLGWTAVESTALGAELTGEQLIERADRALLQAKSSGKRRVVRA